MNSLNSDVQCRVYHSPTVFIILSQIQLTTFHHISTIPILMSTTNLNLRVSCSFFPCGFCTKNLWAFIFSSVRAKIQIMQTITLLTRSYHSLYTCKCYISTLSCKRFGMDTFIAEPMRPPTVLSPLSMAAKKFPAAPDTHLPLPSVWKLLKWGRATVQSVILPGSLPSKFHPENQISLCGISGERNGASGRFFS